LSQIPHNSSDIHTIYR